jgi:hypothetical protein
MRTRWTKTDGCIIIEHGMPVAARLFAIPLLLIAAYLGYQFVAALFEDVRAFSPRDLPVDVVGLVILLILFLAFAFPGLFLFLGGKRVRVDAQQRVVAEETHWWMLTRKSQYSIEPLRAVRIAYETDTEGRSGSPRPVLFTFDVTLVDAQNRGRLIAMFHTSELADARALGSEVSELLHLKLSDHTGKWDPAARGKVPADILPVRQWLEQRGLRGGALDFATWIARGVHFIVDTILRS